MRIRYRLAALASVPALVLGVGFATATAASAGSGSSTGPFNYEADNGAQWLLSNTPTSFAGADKGYGDAGVVVDIGPLADLSNPAITFTGSGPLGDNIWISDSSTSQAATPGGPYTLGAPLNFAYGFDNHDGTFYMASDPGGSYAGQDATLAQLQAEHPTAEAFAWVGVTGGNTSSTVTGHVLKVNGAPAAAYVKVTPDGTASAR
jgi:hypothetical protein